MLTDGTGSGTQSATLRLKQGTYRYQASWLSATVLCKLLAKSLSGSFRVA